MAKYTGYARATGFAPKQIQSGISQIDQETSRTVNALEKQRQSDLQNRDETLRSMRRAAQIEESQAASNQQIAMANQQTVISAASQERQRVLDEFNATTKQNEIVYGTLANFSKKAAVKLQQMQVESLQREWDADLQQVLLEGYTSPQVQQADMAVTEQEIAVVEGQGEIAKASLQGASAVEVARATTQFQNLSPGTQMGRLMLLKGKYGTFMRSSKQAFTDPRTGESFTAAEATRDPVRQQIVNQSMLPAFLESEGLRGVNPGFLFKSGLLPGMIQTNQSMLTKAEENFTTDATAKTKTTAANTIFAAQGDPGATAAAVQSARRSLVPLLGWEATNQYLDDLAMQTDSSGQPLVDTDGYFAGSTGPNGEPIGKGRRNAIQLGLQSNTNAAIGGVLRQRSNAASLWAQEAGARLQSRTDVGTPEEDAAAWEATQQEFRRQFPGQSMPSSLTQLWNGVNGENTAAETRVVEDAIISGSVTPDLIRQTNNPQLRKKLQDAYVKQEAGQFGDNWKDTEKAIKSMARAAAGEDPSALGADTLSSIKLQTAITQDLKQRVANLTGPGGKFEGNPTGAAQYALEEIQKDIVRGAADTTGSSRYSYTDDPTTNTRLFNNLGGVYGAESQEQLNDTMTNIRTSAKAGAPAVYDTVNKTLGQGNGRLEGMVDRFYTQGAGFSFPPEVIEGARLVGTQPAAFLNKLIEQRNAQITDPDKKIPLLRSGTPKTMADPQMLRDLQSINTVTPVTVERAAAQESSTVNGFTRSNMRRHVYTSGNIGPTSTGPHLDVKEVGGRRFSEDALDNYVEVDDPEFGTISLGEIRTRTGGMGDNWDQHVARGSYGIDYGLHSGTKIYLKNGAKVVGSSPSAHGDVLTIELPTGKRYTLIHGNSANGQPEPLANSGGSSPRRFTNAKSLSGATIPTPTTEPEAPAVPRSMQVDQGDPNYFRDFQGDLNNPKPKPEKKKPKRFTNPKTINN